MDAETGDLLPSALTLAFLHVYNIIIYDRRLTLNTLFIYSFPPLKKINIILCSPLINRPGVADLFK